MTPSNAIFSKNVDLVKKYRPHLYTCLAGEEPITGNPRAVIFLLRFMVIKKPGDDMVVFESHRQLIELTKYYIDHPEERRQIARSGQETIKKRHTFRHRMESVFEMLGA